MHERSLGRSGGLASEVSFATDQNRHQGVPLLPTPPSSPRPWSTDSWGPRWVSSAPLNLLPSKGGGEGRGKCRIYSPPSIQGWDHSARPHGHSPRPRLPTIPSPPSGSYTWTPAWAVQAPPVSAPLRLQGPRASQLQPRPPRRRPGPQATGILLSQRTSSSPTPSKAHKKLSDQRQPREARRCVGGDIFKAKLPRHLMQVLNRRHLREGDALC